MKSSRTDGCPCDGEIIDNARRGGVCRKLIVCAGLGYVLVFGGACNSYKNGWMDPTILGGFKHDRKLEVRASLTLDDPPSRIPGATYPTAADLLVVPVEFKIMGGDTLAIEINELRQRQVPFQVQIQVSPTGLVNLPVVGKVRAGGLTPLEFQAALVRRIQEKKILLDPEVTVNPLFLQKATYTIFGIGVSASNNAPLRAGTFPIRRPDLRMLGAINQVGGLNEFVTEVYIFRNYEPAGGGVEALDERSSSPEFPGAPSDRRAQADISDPDPDPDPVSPQPVSPQEELLQVLEESPEDVETGDDPERDVAGELEPQAVDPYLFVDGRFIRNPDHPENQGTAQSVAGGDPIPVRGTVMPATNWSRVAGDNSHRVIVVPADRLRSGDMSINVVVRAGDVIRIVQGEIGVYYVMGQVNRVGAFAFNSEDVTLKAAIAAAGGLSGLAWPSRCTIYRRLGASEQVVQVNLDRIFAGLDDDFLIRRGDIVNVGTHPFAPFLQILRGLTLPNPTTNIGYGFTYARNFADIDSFAVQANPNNQPSGLQSLLLP